MIIGIDHGNAQIKTRNTCFVSGVEEFPTKPPMAADVIQYQSRYWTLVGKRLPVMRDKTKDDRLSADAVCHIEGIGGSQRDYFHTGYRSRRRTASRALWNAQGQFRAVFPQAGDGALHLQR